MTFHRFNCNPPLGSTAVRESQGSGSSKPWVRTPEQLAEGKNFSHKGNLTQKQCDDGTHHQQLYNIVLVEITLQITYLTQDYLRRKTSNRTKLGQLTFFRALQSPFIRTVLPVLRPSELLYENDMNNQNVSVFDKDGDLKSMRKTIKNLKSGT